MSKTLRIGLIGAGRIGQVHAATIAYRVDGAHLAAVTDPLVGVAQAVAAKFRVPWVAADYA
ncbi:MAG: Gfo/Idh/MocA family oxidoreductase, partial [Candidatus Dormibacteraeota bacterium]|nr:Gfo/Idh/MocA family oxidoreductase [Candidatus Dormibacteraeota bacterium]